jgi:hypothetical protein
LLRVNGLRVNRRHTEEGSRIVSIGFCVLYRWKVKPGREQEAQQAWETVTREIRDHEGGLGSRLHRTPDGTWLAYAQWPCREKWEASEVTTVRGKAALQVWLEVIEERLEPILLEPIVDYLVPASDT